jgi:hypothetical protein
MIRELRKWSGAARLAAVALGLSSCAYDPYYSSVHYGHGYGYGYGGSTFTTATFISTGDPRWAYDPQMRLYFDFHRRAYYDPYLFGYYPVGYRPVILHAVPHPHGWRPGSRWIAPPSRVTTVTLRNYSDRYGAYRRTDYPWARRLQEPAVRAGGPPGRVGRGMGSAVPEVTPRRPVEGRPSGSVAVPGSAGVGSPAFRQAPAWQRDDGVEARRATPRGPRGATGWRAR